jgi:hypothetical protein
MKESINVQGFVTFDVYDQNGRFVRSIRDRNLVTSAGKNYMVRRIIGDATASSAVISDIAVGDGTTAATAADTDLENEITRVEIDSISDNDNAGTFVTSLEIGVATGTIAEAGLYTDEPTPTLVSRIVFDTPFTKDQNETIQIIWQFKIGSDS